MSERPKILVVDDEPHNILLLKGYLGSMGYEVVSAENAVIALKLLDRTFDLVLSDVMMPTMNGFEMVEAVRRNPEIHDIPVIMVTTLSEKSDRLSAVEAGANDFITKPLDPVELKVRVRSMLRQKAQQDEIYQFEKELNFLVEQRTLDWRKALGDLKKANQDTIVHLSAAAEYKDEDTGAHIVRMSRYSELIARKMGLGNQEVHLIHRSSPMHDLGKIAIPDEILLKPGKLTPSEWEIMKKHTTLGGEILGDGSSEYIAMGAVIALTHHEKWDGSGYPKGLAGEDIPLAGRICAVADVFDALTSVRPYKEAFTVGKALKIMRDGRGAHFDPQVLDVFLDNIEDVRLIKDQNRD